MAAHDAFEETPQPGLRGPTPVAGDTWADQPERDLRRRRPRGPLLVALLVLPPATVVAVAAFVLWLPLGGAGHDPAPNSLGSDTALGAVIPSDTATTPSLIPSTPDPDSRTASPSVEQTPAAVPLPGETPSPSLIPLAPHTGTIIASSGWCLDDLSSGTDEGNPIQVWPCNGSTAETFTFSTDGTLRVLNRCVRPVGSTPTSGTAVQLGSCDGNRYQTWSLRSDQAIVNTDSGLCLTNSGVKAADNRYYTMVATCDGGAGQLWIVPGSALSARPGLSDEAYLMRQSALTRLTAP